MAEIPAWKDFQIVPSGKYLGVFLGANGIRQTFEAVESKYLSRCYDLRGRLYKDMHYYTKT